MSVDTPARDAPAVPGLAPRPDGDPFWDANADRLLGTVQRLVGRLPHAAGGTTLAQVADLIEGLPPPTARRVAAHPGFRRAIRAVLRHAAEGRTDDCRRAATDLARVTVLPALDAGLSYDLIVSPDGGGRLTLPGTPGMTTTAARPLRLRSDGTRLTAHDPDDTAVATIDRASEQHRHCTGSLALRHLPTLDGTSLTVDGQDAGAADLIIEMNDPRSFDENGARTLTAVVDPGQDVLTALTVAQLGVGESWPELAAEIRRTVAVVVPFVSREIVGYSHVGLLGTIFLNVGLGPTTFLEERLVHESSHNQLFLQQQVPLVEDDATLLRSPLRRDHRPPSGVLHASFVAARCAIWADRASAARPELGPRSRELATAALDGAETLIAHAALTGAGRHLVRQITDEAGGLT